MFYVGGAGSGTLGNTTGRSAYGNAIGTGLKYGTSAVTKHSAQDGSNSLLTVLTLKVKKLVLLLSLGNQERDFVSSNTLLKSPSDGKEIGHALKHVVAAAMFKELGKTTALIAEESFAKSLKIHYTLPLKEL